jgi:hypothetical protein
MRADRMTFYLSLDVIVGVGVQALSAAPLGAFGCRSVFIFSRSTNTLPIFVGNTVGLLGGLGAAGNNGIIILPSDGISIDIDNISKISVVEPTGAGTQIICVAING